MPTHVLIPGTFDPPTLGHLDLVWRAASLFERVSIGVAEHPTKDALFSAAERVALLEECVAELTGPNSGVQIAVVELPGLVVDGCRTLECDAIVRGVRSGTDYDYEAQMAATNRSLLPTIDTLLLSTSPELAHITSTLVRQVARMGGDASLFVPDPVARALKSRFGKER